jgi:hypothetical protein
MDGTNRALVHGKLWYTTILQLVTAFYYRTQELLTDYGPAGAAGAWATPHAAGQFTGLRAGGSSGKAPPSCRYRRTFSGTTGRPGEADAAVDSAGVAVPFEELRAGRIRRMAMPEYTVASGRLDHTTFRERADASVRCRDSDAKPGPGTFSLLMPRLFLDDNQRLGRLR